MTLLVPAVGGALMVIGIIGLIAGIQKTPVKPAAPRSNTRFALPRLSRRTQLLLAAGLTLGVVVALVSGWLLGLVLVPAATVGLPVLLSAGEETSRIRRLEAMEEWIRSLSGVLTAGVGLEQALIATLRSRDSCVASQTDAMPPRPSGWISR